MASLPATERDSKMSHGVFPFPLFYFSGENSGVYSMVGVLGCLRTKYLCIYRWVECVTPIEKDVARRIPKNATLTLLS